MSQSCPFPQNDQNSTFIRPGQVERSLRSLLRLKIVRLTEIQYFVSYAISSVLKVVNSLKANKTKVGDGY